MVASIEVKPATHRDRALAEAAAPHLGRWAGLWGVPDLPASLQLRSSTRMRTSLGRCAPARSEIRIADFLLEGPRSLLLEVVCHEAAHAAVHCLHGGEARPHGHEWRALMRAAGYPGQTRMPAERLSVLPTDAARRRILWEHRCPSCRRSRLAGRPVRAWRCTACRAEGLTGRIVITRRDAALGEPV